MKKFLGSEMNNADRNTTFGRVTESLREYFARIQISPARPIDQLGTDEANDYVLVLYAPNGLPSQVTTISASDGPEITDSLIQTYLLLGRLGTISTYRIIDTGDGMISGAINKMMDDLFGMVLLINVEEAMVEPDGSSKAGSKGKGLKGGSKKGKQGRDDGRSC